MADSRTVLAIVGFLVTIMALTALGAPTILGDEYDPQNIDACQSAAQGQFYYEWNSKNEWLDGDRIDGMNVTDPGLFSGARLYADSLPQIWEARNLDYPNNAPSAFRFEDFEVTGDGYIDVFLYDGPNPVNDEIVVGLRINSSSGAPATSGEISGINSDEVSIRVQMAKDSGSSVSPELGRMIFASPDADVDSSNVFSDIIEAIPGIGFIDKMTCGFALMTTTLGILFGGTSYTLLSWVLIGFGIVIAFILGKVIISGVRG